MEIVLWEYLEHISYYWACSKLFYPIKSFFWKYVLFLKVNFLKFLNVEELFFQLSCLQTEVLSSLPKSTVNSPSNWKISGNKVVNWPSKGCIFHAFLICPNCKRVSSKFLWDVVDNLPFFLAFTYFSPMLTSFHPCSEDLVKSGAHVTKLLAKLTYPEMLLDHLDVRSVRCSWLEIIIG